MNRNIFEPPSTVNCSKCKFFDKDKEYNGEYRQDDYKGFCTLSSLYKFSTETKCTGFRQS